MTAPPSDASFAVAAQRPAVAAPSSAVAAQRSAVAAQRSAVVVNPVKVPDLDEFRRTVESVLARAGWPAPLWFETTPDDPGVGQTHEAMRAGAEVVFACGGDGTVMACVCPLAGTGVALAVLPAGTGNLLAANLGLHHDVRAGVLLAVRGGRRRLDVGSMDGRYFAVMAGIGFDAQMLDATSDRAKARIGWPAYVLGALRHLRDRPMRVRLRLDGERLLRRRARTVLVGNVGRLPGGMRLLPEAEPDDGLLDVAVLSPGKLRHWASLGWAVLTRRRRVPGMETFRAARVTVTTDRSQARQLDGDLIEPGRTLTVAVRPAALTLCVPQPERAPDLAEGAERVEDERASAAA